MSNKKKYDCNTKKLVLAYHPNGKFNNKAAEKPAPNSKLWKIEEVNITSLKHLYRTLKNMPSDAMVIDSRFTGHTEQFVRLSGDYFSNETQFLIIDSEYSDTLPKKHKKVMTLKEAKRFPAEVLGYKGSFVLVSSSRWEIKGELGWHFYIPLDGWIDRRVLKDWIEMKLNNAGALYYGTSRKKSAKMLIKLKRSTLVDITIYTVARRIYETKQQSSGERKKIVELVEGTEECCLSVKSIKMALNGSKKQIEYKTFPKTQRRLDKLEAKGLKKYGKRKWAKKKQEYENGITRPADRWETPDGSRTTAEIVEGRCDVKFMSELDKDRYAGDFYWNDGVFPIFVDHHSGKRWQPIDEVDELPAGKYLPDNWMTKEVGLYAAPTGAGKTTAIEKLADTVLLVIRTRFQAKKVADDKGYEYLKASHVGGRSTENFKWDEGVYVCTYSKWHTLDVPSHVAVVVDEAHNLFVDELNKKTMIQLLEKVLVGEIYAITGTPLPSLLSPIKHLKRGGNPIKLTIIRNAHWKQVLKNHSRWGIFDNSSKIRNENTAKWLEGNGFGDTAIISADSLESEIHGKNVVSTSTGTEAADIFMRIDGETLEKGVGIIAVDPTPIELVQWLGRFRDGADAVYIFISDNKLLDKDAQIIKARDFTKEELKLMKWYKKKEFYEKLKMLPALIGLLPKLIKEFTESDMLVSDAVLLRLMAKKIMNEAKYSKSLFIQLLEQWGNFEIAEGNRWARTELLTITERIKIDSWDDVNNRFSEFGSNEKREDAVSCKMYERYNEVLNLTDDKASKEEKLELFNSSAKRRALKMHRKLEERGAYDEIEKAVMDAIGRKPVDGMSITDKKKLKLVAEAIRKRYKGLPKNLTYRQVLECVWQIDSKKVLSMKLYPIVEVA